MLNSILNKVYFKQLAKNKNHQEKLRQILLKLRDDNGHFEYDSLTENPYLEQVIYGRPFLFVLYLIKHLHGKPFIETLRLHPVLHIHFRECTKEYKAEISKGKTVTIEKGTPINLAIYELHRDPEYYGPDAEDFNPDRFDQSKGGFKTYVDKGVLFPFGEF